MARFGARLADSGFPVIPIMPGAKKPGRYLGGEWRDYPGWTRHCKRATTENEIGIWSTWPGCGIGIAGGMVAGVDIDIVTDPELAIGIEKLARERLGDTPAIRIGLPPKRLLVYRTSTPFKGIRRQPVEILCEGQQFVAYAIHPGTGRPYEWPEEPLADLDIGSLPEITAEQVRAFVDEAWQMIPENLRPSRLSNSHGNACPAMLPVHGDQRGTRQAIEQALCHIPNDDLDYDSWVRIGMALKGALGEDGAGPFSRWSAQSVKNIPEMTMKAWASFRPTSIGAGTIYHHAMERGWKPDAGLVLNGAHEQQHPHPAQSLLNQLTVRIPEPESQSPEPATPMPSLDPSILGGVLGDMVAYMIKTARRPQPILAVGASLCALGALMGRKYRNHTNLRTNLYFTGIADSGSGKNHAREVINELFVEAGLGNYLGGNKIASGSGLLTALHRQPAILFQLDEFGMLLAAAADRKRSPRHITEILDNMTELYTAAGGIFLGAEYANRDGKNERRDINQPCLSVYGTTTPLHFWNALQSANVADGSLARFIIVRTTHDYPEENEAAGIRRSPLALLKSLQLIASGGGHQPKGNLAGKTAGPVTGVDPLTVQMDAQARDRFRALGKEITGQLREARGTPFTSILARISENAAKIALVKAVSIDPVSPLIRDADAEWAIAFVRHCAENTMIEVERNVADNETERNHKRLMEVIRGASKAGITKNNLIRRTQFLDKRQRDEIVATLIEAGMITSMVRPSGTKPAMIYQIVEEQG